MESFSFNVVVVVNDGDLWCAVVRNLIGDGNDKEWLRTALCGAVVVVVVVGWIKWFTGAATAPFLRDRCLRDDDDDGLFLVVVVTTGCGAATAATVAMVAVDAMMVMMMLGWWWWNEWADELNWMNAGGALTWLPERRECFVSPIPACLLVRSRRNQVVQSIAVSESMRHGLQSKRWWWGWWHWWRWCNLAIAIAAVY